jgi:hypothetical protein
MVIKFLEESYPKIALALKSTKSLNLNLRRVLLLGNQSTFDLCCNRGFMSMIRKASCALNMTCNGGGLKITKQGSSRDTNSGFDLASRLSPTSYA